MKNSDDGLQSDQQPGPLVSLLGGRVQQFYALDSKVPVTGPAGQGNAQIWAEQLQTLNPATKVELRYGKANGWLDEKPALLTRQLGKGSITYVGAWLDKRLLDQLTSDWLQAADVHAPVPGVPKEVEVCVRSDATHQVVILINHGEQPQSVHLPSPMRRVLAGGDAQSAVLLKPYGVAVLDAGAAGDKQP